MLRRKLLINFMFDLWKHLLVLQILLENLFRKFFTAFRQLTMTLQIVRIPTTYLTLVGVLLGHFCSLWSWKLFRKPPMTWPFVPKASYDLKTTGFFLNPMREWTLEIDFSVTEKKVWLSVQPLELGSIFWETSKSFIFVIFFSKSKTFF